MRKPQWIVLCIAVLLVVGLFAGTQGRFFGERKNNKPLPSTTTPSNHEALPVDSILYYAKKNLPLTQVARLTSLENSIVRGDVAEQKLHLMHQLARYWMDSARAFTPMFWYPYAWYTAEAARLENSPKSLSFAARLFLDALTKEQSHELKRLGSGTSKRFVPKSLKLNPNNDSAKVGLGATILYSGHESPMAGITMIREVADKNPDNVFAQMTLAEASLMSGQMDKAVERFKTVLKLQPANLQAGLLLADTYEKMQKKDDAIKAYQNLLPHITIAEMKAEVEKRITQLKTK